MSDGYLGKISLGKYIDVRKFYRTPLIWSFRQKILRIILCIFRGDVRVFPYCSRWVVGWFVQGSQNVGTGYVF